MLRKSICAFIKNEKGATAIEYTLIAALIAIVCITAFNRLGKSMNQKLSLVAQEMENTGVEAKD